MERPTIVMKKKMLFILSAMLFLMVVFVIRVGYIQIFKGEEYQSMAYEQQTRDRLISPKRGNILDKNGIGIAVTETVNAVSVINAQIKDYEGTAKYLSDVLNLDYNNVLEKVKKRVALVRIKTKVDSETAMQIRKKNLPGVVVDEDVKRVYPYSTLASQVIGFVGKDNQGIIGLEAKYDEFLKGEQGKILTLTDSRGLTVDNAQERVEPVDGLNLVTTLDVTIEQYAEQTLAKIVEAKGAKRGIIIVMNPQNGAIYAMANNPDFDLNSPFTINNEELLGIWETLSAEERNEALNKMWRNTAINGCFIVGQNKSLRALSLEP